MLKPQTINQKKTFVKKTFTKVSVENIGFEPINILIRVLL